MARHSDPTGVSNTCPVIDRIIAAASEISDYAERPGHILSGFDYGRLKEIEKEIEANAEEVRGMNTELREFGTEAHSRAEEMEALADERADRIAQLEDEINTLQSDIEHLNSELKEAHEYASQG